MKRKMCILVHLLLFLSPVYGHLVTFTLYTQLDKTTWENAQAFCRKHHIDLVKIRNERENQFFSGYGWIGLHRKDSSSPWKWSRGGEIANFTKWQSGEPATHQHCAGKVTEQWWSSDCSAIRSFMCYDVNLVLVKENKTWEEALDHCRSLNGSDPTPPFWNHRYDLATLITPEDHTYAREIAQEATTDEVWTGLRFLAGEWLWVGGEQMQYKDIPRCPTDGFCGVLEKSGTAAYGTRDCQMKRNFFCYKI